MRFATQHCTVLCWFEQRVKPTVFCLHVYMHTHTNTQIITLACMRVRKLRSIPVAQRVPVTMGDAHAPGKTRDYFDAAKMLKFSASSGVRAYYRTTHAYISVVRRDVAIRTTSTSNQVACKRARTKTIPVNNKHNRT